MTVVASRSPRLDALGASIRLIAAAVIVGGAPGLIPLVAAFHGRAPSYGLIGFLWIAANAGCGVLAYCAPWRLVRVGEPIALALAMTALAVPFIPDSMAILFPGIVLWLAVAKQGCSVGDEGLVEGALTLLRRTYG